VKTLGLEFIITILNQAIYQSRRKPMSNQRCAIDKCGHRVQVAGDASC